MDLEICGDKQKVTIQQIIINSRWSITNPTSWVHGVVVSDDESIWVFAVKGILCKSQGSIGGLPWVVMSCLNVISWADRP
jgi:hypothetical protein